MPTLWALIAARISGASATPNLVDQLAVERVDQGILDRVALQGVVHRLLDHGAFQHPRDRPFNRLALDRGDHCLLGGSLNRLVDPGRLADVAGAAHTGGEQAHGERQRLARGAFAVGRRVRVRAVCHRPASIGRHLPSAGG
jgi:hypothetical protein